MYFFLIEQGFNPVFTNKTMNSKTIQTIFFIAIRFILGGIMLYGGYQKFAKPFA